MRDWHAWHAEYEIPGSRLSRRLEVVQARLSDVLDATDGRALRLLALCAGEGRDVIPVLASRPDGGRVKAVLVELDPDLAGRAERAARSAGLATVEVRCRDASDVSSFRDLLPVDILMLCGIFGNVVHASVRAIAQAVPALVAPGGYVIWTRGGGPPIDHRPDVRRWFTESGMPEVSFDGDPETFGVGVNRIAASGGVLPKGPLFTFVEKDATF